MVFEDPDPNERLVDESLQDEDQGSEVNLRPALLDEFVGQSLIKENIYSLASRQFPFFMLRINTTFTASLSGLCSFSL